MPVMKRMTTKPVIAHLVAVSVVNAMKAANHETQIPHPIHHRRPCSRVGDRDDDLQIL